MPLLELSELWQTNPLSLMKLKMPTYFHLPYPTFLFSEPTQTMSTHDSWPKIPLRTHLLTNSTMFSFYRHHSNSSYVYISTNLIEWFNYIHVRLYKSNNYQQILLFSICEFTLPFPTCISSGSRLNNLKELRLKLCHYLLLKYKSLHRYITYPTQYLSFYIMH